MPTPPELATVVLRRADSSESEAVAELIWRVREQNVGPIPQQVHSLAETRAWMRDMMFPTREVWVADTRGALVALMLLRHPDWLDQLYVDASFCGKGLGSSLLALAKARCPADLQLWTFQSNFGARRFYERHGFVPVEYTDGDNEEQSPDVRYKWSPDLHL